MKEIKNRIENIEKVFIVSRRKNKLVKPELGYDDLTGSKIVYCFPNIKNAKKFVDYWINGDKVYDILERKLG